MYKVYNLEFFRQKMATAIKVDKNKFKRGIIRYELIKDLSGRINCIDSHMFNIHTKGYNSQGFFEYKRKNVLLENIPCELVVMRHEDESKIFDQIDGLLGGYLKADCELCYYEVNLQNI